jgi:hypothetical protein
VPGTRAAAAKKGTGCGEASVTDRQHSLTWAQRLKRVFTIDIEVCRRCGGKLRVIANIEEQATIERILEHLGGAGESVDPPHPSRAPPQGDLFGALAAGCGAVGNDAERQAAVVAANCLDCHNAIDQLGNLNLETAAFVALSRKLAKVCFALLQNDSQFDPLAHRPACMST